MESTHQPPSDTIAAPVAQSARLISLDVIRGVALLGILIMNIQVFSMIFSAYENPYAFGDMTGLNYWARWFSEVFADQKFLTIFSMLFGASIMLMAEKSMQKGQGPYNLHYKRMLWLAVFGAMHAFLLWAGDILLFYAITGVFAVLFYKWRARNLIITGIIFMVIFSLLMLLIGMSKGEMTAEDIAGITKFWTPTDERIAEILAAHRSDWFGQWEVRVTAYLKIASGLPIMIFRFLGAMLIGMGLYKAGLLDASRSKTFYIRHGLVSLVIGYGLTLFGMQQIAANNNEAFYAMFFGSQYGYYGSFILAWGYICLLQFFVVSHQSKAGSAEGSSSANGSESFLVKYFAPVGQMALSNYIFQSLVCGTIFYGWGFGFYGSVERAPQLGIVVGVWIAQIILSRWWLSRYRFGPLEWLWRSLTYMQKQPMAKS